MVVEMDGINIGHSPVLVSGMGRRTIMRLVVGAFSRLAPETAITLMVKRFVWKQYLIPSQCPFVKRGAHRWCDPRPVVRFSAMGRKRASRIGRADVLPRRFRPRYYVSIRRLPSPRRREKD